MQQWKMIVSGRVQGVFYRANVVKFVLENHLKLTGYIKNLSDGQVEILAQGDNDELSKLLSYCKKGPALARVDQVETLKEEIINTNTFNNFSVK